MPMRIPSGENPFATDVAVGNPGKYSLVDPSLEGSPESKLSKEASEKLAKWQGELDRTQTMDAINQIEQQASDLELEYSQIKGKNAVDPEDGKPLSETYGNKFREGYDAILNKIKRPEVRAKVSEFVQARNNKFMEHLNKHIVNEQGVVAVNVENDMARNAVRQMSDADMGVARGGFAVGRAIAQQKASRTGISLESALVDICGPGHVAQIGNFCIKKDYKGAKEYLSQFRSEMTPQQIGRAEKAIDATKIDALSDREFKKATKGFNYMADETQFAQDTVDAAKKLSGISNEKVREQAEAKFAAYLRNETKKRKLESEQLRLTLLEIVDSFKKDGNEAQATVPQDMLEELRALDRNGANSVDVYLSKMRKHGEIQSDPNIKTFIESVEEKDRDQFMKIDFSQYAHVLSKKDIAYYVHLQARYSEPDNAYNAFETELKQAVDYNNLKTTSQRSKVKQAARQIYEIEAQKSKLGYLDADGRSRVISYVFAGNTKTGFMGWLEDSNWEEVSSKDSSAYENMSLQKVRGDNRSVSDDVDNEFKKAGGNPENMTKEQRSIMQAYVVKKILPPQLWRECRESLIAKRLKMKNPKQVTNDDIRMKCLYELAHGYSLTKGDANGNK